MPRRPPSASSIRSQIRSAARKAERDLNRELAAVQRKAERDANAEARRRQRRFEAHARRSRPPLATYTVAERVYLDRFRDSVALDEIEAERERDLFLCHAWADRHGAARELFDALVEVGVDVWFSEENVDLGTNLPRQLDRGIRCSRVGVVLVTPAISLRFGWAGLLTMNSVPCLRRTVSSPSCTASHSRSCAKRVRY